MDKTAAMKHAKQNMPADMFKTYEMLANFFDSPVAKQPVETIRSQQIHFIGQEPEDIEP